VARFFADLKRRHIYRVAALYAVAAWVLIQLVGNLTPMLRLPDWAGSLVLVLLLVFFPIALIFAWIHEWPAGEANVPATATTKLDWVILGGVALTVFGLLYQLVADSVDSPAAATLAQPSGNVSIAVLPLANLSGDDAQEFFSDGMTDEITSALAKVPNLRVVGRSSAFQFKDQSKDLRAIGEVLGATFLIDGSVRRAGNRVRVTAQLVRADDGINLWTDSYDRELTDVFAIEEDIAQAIAGALRAPLGLADGERLISNRTTNVDSYQDYLRGRSLVRGRIVEEAVATLESAVARDPNFAPAWAMLSQAYRALLDYNALARRPDAPLEEARGFVQSTLERGERAARRAIELDPRHDGGHAALATIRATRGEWAEADDLFKQAFAIDANNPEALYRYGQTLNIVGRVADSLRVYEQLQAIEPLVPIYQLQTASQLYVAGRNQAAIASLEATTDEGPARFYRNLYLARVYAATGRFADSAAALLALRGEPQVGLETIAAAADLIRAPGVSAARASLPALGDLNFVYAYVGAESRLMEPAERGLQIGNMVSQSTFWGPAWAPVRQTERFKALLRDIGLVDYWRERGWPDLCRPRAEADFVCD
jgi:adenylate cyclase